MVVLFDVDGTLIDGGGAGRRAFEKGSLAVLGSADVLRHVRFDGLTDPLIARAAIEAVRPGTVADPGEIKRLISAYLTHIDDEVARSERYRVLPGVVALLDRLVASGALLGLCTGNVERGARSKLARGDLNRYFPFGGFADDGEPRAEILRSALGRAASRLGASPDPEGVWVVGDTPADLQAGRTCGVRVMLVASGRHPVAELSALGADRCVASLDEPGAGDHLVAR